MWFNLNISTNWSIKLVLYGKTLSHLCFNQSPDTAKIDQVIYLKTRFSSVLKEISERNVFEEIKLMSCMGKNEKNG